MCVCVSLELLLCKTDQLFIVAYLNPDNLQFPVSRLQTADECCLLIECRVNQAKRMCVLCLDNSVPEALEHIDRASWRISEHFRLIKMGLKCE